MLWPLLGDPLHARTHMYIRDSRSRARVGTLDPLRARARRLAFFIRISVRPTWTPRRSFSRSLCESGCRVGCFVPLPDTRVLRLAYARVCVRASAAIHLLFPFWISPPLPRRPTLPVRTCNGRVACHSIAHARWEPTHARMSLSVCTGARVLARAPCPPHTRAADSR